MASSKHQTSLTAHLLSTHGPAYASATRHPFLTNAGNGTLAGSTVCEWLVQDKYYQLGYVNFIGSLLSKLDLSNLVTPPSHQRRLRNTMDVLIDALSAIRQEIHFYDRTVEKYKLNLEYAEMIEVTREYVELFREIGKNDQSPLQGLVLLWATEHVRPVAFSFVLFQIFQEAARLAVKYCKLY